MAENESEAVANAAKESAEAIKRNEATDRIARGNVFSEKEADTPGNSPQPWPT